MKCIFILLAVLQICIISAAEKITLVKNNQSNYRIVLLPQASPCEHQAAEELQKILLQSTGVQLPVTTGIMSGADNKIIIGTSDSLQVYYPELAHSTRKPDQIILQNNKNALILSGTAPRGPLYSVYEFLENFLGVRYLTSQTLYIPSLKEVAFPADLKLSYAPPFATRGMLYYHNKDMRFLSWQRLNGEYNFLSSRYGGHNQFIGEAVHTYNSLISPEKYGICHPEFFSKINGQRVIKNSQLCLSNQQLQKEVIKNALALAKDGTNGNIISISQNDNTNFCRCDQCSAFAEQHGAQSALTVNLANKVAEALEQNGYNIMVDTLAYTYTFAPPQKINVHPNVIIRICSIGNEMRSAFDSKENSFFKENVEQWKKIAKQLYLWHYVANYANYLQAHPTLFHLPESLHFAVRNNVKNIYMEGDNHSGMGHFSELKGYIIAKLLWNSCLNPEKLQEEFLNLYYGAASPYLKQYINLQKETMKQYKPSLSCSMQNGKLIWTQSTIQAANRLFDSAEQAVAHSSKFLDRVVKERFAVYLAQAEFSSSAAEREELIKKMREISIRNNLRVFRQSGKNTPNELFESLQQSNFANQQQWPRPLQIAPTRFYKQISTFEYWRTNRFMFFAQKDGRHTIVLKNATAGDWVMNATPFSSSEFIELKNHNPFSVYLVARSQGNTKQAYCNFSFFDTVSRTYFGSKTIALDDISGEQYHLIELGTHALSPSCYLYTTGVNRDGAELHIAAFLVAGKNSSTKHLMDCTK